MLDSPNPCSRVHDPASWSYDSLQSLRFRALRPPSWECEKAKIILCPFSLKLEFLFVLFPAAKDLQAPLQLCQCSAK